MAACTTRLLNLLTLLSLFLAILLRSHMATSSSSSSFDSYGNEDEDEDDDDDEYILDSPLIVKKNSTTRLRSSRFLASIIKKGSRCDPNTGGICNGVSANKGKSYLLCCKKHCRNVLRDWNNCGKCGHRCRMTEKCCDGECVNVYFDHDNCGKCNVKCFPFESCRYGICGYD